MSGSYFFGNSVSESDGDQYSSLDALMEDYGISNDSNEAILENFDITSVLCEYYSEVQYFLEEMFTNALKIQSSGISNKMQALREEEEGFFTKVKNKIVEVWNKVVSFFSNMVNKVRSSMFGKLGPIVKEIKSAVDSGKMDYSKAIGKEMYDLDKLDYLAKAFVKICNKAKEKIKSIAAGDEHDVHYAGASGKPTSNLNFTNRNVSDDLIAKAYLSKLFRDEAKDIVSWDKSASDGAGGYKDSNYINSNASYMANTHGTGGGIVHFKVKAFDALENEEKAKEAIRKTANDALGKVDKSLKMMQSALEALRNEVTRIVNGLDSMFKKGKAYKDPDEGKAEDDVEGKRSEQGDTKIRRKKFGINGITTFAREILSLATNIVNEIVNAVRANVMVMKSCITKEKTSEKIEESYNYGGYGNIWNGI